MQVSRARGDDFDTAWATAMLDVQVLLVEYPKVAAHDWGVAFRATKARWQRVYCEPTAAIERHEAALVLIYESQGGLLAAA